MIDEKLQLANTPFEGVYESAMQIVDADGVRRVNDNMYRVKSRSVEDKWHTLTYDRGHLTCSCDHAKCGNKLCAHVMAVFVYAGSKNPVMAECRRKRTRT